MKNALNKWVGMLGDMFLWLVANLKQGVVYFIKQGGGNYKLAWVYLSNFGPLLQKFHKQIKFLVLTSNIATQVQVRGTRNQN